jgi:hypothetical protein
MMQQRHRTELTIPVRRAQVFHACPADLLALHEQICARRIEMEAALGVGVIDATGVRVRVIGGTGPATVSVGRHSGCDLSLRQRDGSLRHAVIVRDDRGIRVVDLASSFGLAGSVEAPFGRWTVTRAGDSLIVAVALDLGQALRDLDELHALCTGLAHPHALVPDTRPRFRPTAFLPATSQMAAPPPMMMHGRPTPPVQDGDGISLEHLAGTVLMGRDERCQIRFSSERVSRLHAALLEVRVGGLRRAMVVDIGSTNGTSVLQARDGIIREVALGPAGRGRLVGPGDMVDLAGVRVRIVGTLNQVDNEGSGAVRVINAERGQE